MLNPHDLSHVKNFSFDRAFWLLEQLCWPEKALPRSVKPTDPHFATQVWPTCPLTTPRKWQENVMEDLGSELGRHLRRSEK